MDWVKEIITNDIDVKVEFDTPKDLGLHGIKKTFETFKRLFFLIYIFYEFSIHFSVSSLVYVHSFDCVFSL